MVFLLLIVIVRKINFCNMNTDAETVIRTVPCVVFVERVL